MYIKNQKVKMHKSVVKPITTCAWKSRTDTVKVMLTIESAQVTMLNKAVVF